jgi:hypothetical protein
MKYLYTKSKWELPNATLAEFARKLKGDGFDGADLYLPGQSETPEEIGSLFRDEGLTLIAHIGTAGKNPAEQLASFEERIRLAVASRPLLINCHAGQDIQAFADSARLFARSVELEREYGVPICHETHRGLPLFNAPDTERFLDAVPGLRLTADFSHWVCVHESTLENQPERVEKAIARSHHIHARVGFSEGPQVSHPLAPENKPWLDLHLGWWKRIVAARAARGETVQTVTPEFGPVPYMPVIPFENRPVADAWTVNVEMMRWLRTNLG